MRNPLSSEADAFRWVVAIGLAAASVIALTLLTRPVLGVVWAALLLGFGAGVGYRSLRDSLFRRSKASREIDKDDSQDLEPAHH